MSDLKPCPECKRLTIELRDTEAALKDSLAGEDDIRTFDLWAPVLEKFLDVGERKWVTASIVGFELHPDDQPEEDQP